MIDIGATGNILDNKTHQTIGYQKLHRKSKQKNHIAFTSFMLLKVDTVL